MSEETDKLHEAYDLGIHKVPGIWAYIFPEDFRYFKFSPESQSSCSDCPEIKAHGFDPRIRCCTYHPRMPNFMLGLALENPKVAGLIRSFIREGFATPEGLQHTGMQAYDSVKQHADDNFGRNRVVVCRFLDLDTSLCQVYLYRNSVCCTFFCVYARKKDGEEFWDRLQSLAGQVETALSQWAMARLGINVKEYFDRFDGFAGSLDKSVNPGTSAWSEDALKVLWHDWHGREEEYYLACADLVRNNKHDLYEIACGVDLMQPLAYELALRDSFPDAMKKELDANGPIGGQIVPIEDLWYLVKVAHHNLWVNPSE